jgi:iron complex transport system permease protein
MLILAVLFTSTAVAYAGGIAFVGLIAPHAARLLFKGKVGYALVATPLIGGTIVVGADLLARILFQPLEVPTGALTAALGAPYFFWLLIKRSKKHA